MNGEELRFVLDDNINRKPSKKPENTINTRELYRMNGLKEKKIPDKKLLELSQEQGYIIVTKDKGLILRANRLSITIIHAEGSHGQRWCVIPKEKKFKNRVKIDRYVNLNFVETMEELEILPFFTHNRKIGDVEH